MGYIPDVQYAPFYVALDKGYYREAGLDVEFDFRFETDGVKLVATGELPFAVASGEQVVLARSQELPVVYVMQWFRRFPIAVVARESAGIRTPADLKGKRVGLPEFGGASYVGWRGLLWKSGLAAGDVDEQNLGGFVQVQALQQDRVDAVVGYANNEPIQLEQSGVPVDVLYVADYVNLVANGLISNDQTVAEQPELVAAIVGATLRGVAYTLEHPDEALAITQVHVPEIAKDEASLARARAVLAASLELWRGEPLGVSREEDWQTTVDVLLQMGAIDQPVAVEALFTNRFAQPAP
jgi:NitT/TauT family transport system substrate-binding protein